MPLLRFSIAGLLLGVVILWVSISVALSRPTSPLLGIGGNPMVAKWVPPRATETNAPSQFAPYIPTEHAETWSTNVTTGSKL